MHSRSLCAAQLVGVFVFTRRLQYMQLTYAHDELRLFWLREKPKDHQIEPHAGVKMAQGILVYICGYNWMHMMHGQSFACFLYISQIYTRDPRPPILPRVMESSAMRLKLGVFRFVPITHAKINAKQMRPRSSSAVQRFLCVYLHIWTAADAGDIHEPWLFWSRGNPKTCIFQFKPHAWIKMVQVLGYLVYRSRIPYESLPSCLATHSLLACLSPPFLPSHMKEPVL